LWRPEQHGARLRAGEPAILFLPAIPRVVLLVFLLVSAAIDEENYFTFKWLWQWYRPGAPKGCSAKVPAFYRLSEAESIESQWARPTFRQNGNSGRHGKWATEPEPKVGKSTRPGAQFIPSH